MSTRGMVVVQRCTNCAYELYYRHYDTYPQALGVELVRAMTKGKKIEQVMLEVGATAESKTTKSPEDAFLKVQGDLEWIYCIENLDPEGCITSRTSLEIYKTSCPYFWFKGDGNAIDFVFRVWGCSVDYFPNDVEAQMNLLDLMSHVVLRGLFAYAKASGAPVNL
jgi:hypothetical protein